MFLFVLYIKRVEIYRISVRKSDKYKNRSKKDMN